MRTADTYGETQQLNSLLNTPRYLGFHEPTPMADDVVHDAWLMHDAILDSFILRYRAAQRRKRMGTAGEGEGKRAGLLVTESTQSRR
jgi:hypothetical protein